MLFKTNFKRVAEFMNSFGQRVSKKPRLVNLQLATLRHRLISEELDELGEAMDKKDLLGIADALTDLLYVVYGAGHTYGINLDKCFKEVHRSNMSKLGPDGKPLYREDGKVLKGPNFIEPNLEKFVK